MMRFLLVAIGAGKHGIIKITIYFFILQQNRCNLSHLPATPITRQSARSKTTNAYILIMSLKVKNNACRRIRQRFPACVWELYYHYRMAYQVGTAPRWVFVRQGKNIHWIEKTRTTWDYNFYIQGKYIIAVPFLLFICFPFPFRQKHKWKIPSPFNQIPQIKCRSLAWLLAMKV